MKRWGIAAIVAVAMMVAGCGGDDDDGEIDPRREALLAEMDLASVEYDEDLVVEAAQQYCSFLVETNDMNRAVTYAEASYGPELAGLRQSFFEAAQNIYCPTWQLPLAPAPTEPAPGTSPAEPQATQSPVDSPRTADAPDPAWRDESDEYYVDPLEGADEGYPPTCEEDPSRC